MLEVMIASKALETATQIFKSDSRDRQTIKRY